VPRIPTATATVVSGAIGGPSPPRPLVSQKTTPPFFRDPPPHHQQSEPPKQARACKDVLREISDIRDERYASARDDV
jgi:hypothetical protein